ncbi:hypothetical protein FRC03_010560 [Tulasnella sp. 419]|nr:hypothetical protein FRC03_010560 [Tulasnella sp. 419]
MESVQSHLPIDKLALELLWKIFDYYCEPIVSQSPASNKWHNEDFQAPYARSPIILTHVSSYWRDAAMKLSSLWRFIRVTKNPSFAKISVWLERSGNVPIDIVLDGVLDGSIMQVYRLLMPHSHRWRSFYMENHPLSMHSMMFTCFDDVDPQLRQSYGFPESHVTTPSLQSIELRKLKSINSDLHRCLDIISFESTVLTRLVVVDAFHEWRKYSMSFTQITYFEFSQHSSDSAYFAGLMAYISLMEKLQYLQLEVVDDCEPESLHELGFPMVLSDLTTFRLHIESACPPLWAWLANLDAPKLSRLDIWHESPDGDDYWHDEWENKGWGSLLAEVRLLSLTEFHWTPDLSMPCGSCLAPLISAVPTISRITVEASRDGGNCYDPDELFPSSCHCPNLRYLDIKGWNLPGDPTKEIAFIDNLRQSAIRLNPNVIATIDGAPL